MQGIRNSARLGMSGPLASPPGQAGEDPVLAALQPGLQQPINQMAEPFVWAEGGRRKTAEEIDLDREIAQSLLEKAGDASPVSHWLQGAARMADGLVGGLKMREAKKDAQSNADADAEIAAALAQSIGRNGDGGSATMGNAELASLIANPRTAKPVKALAQSLMDHNLNAAEPFTIGRSRVQVDPLTGRPQTLYDGPEDFEEYAAELGLEPGTDEYYQAVEDYVLKGSGPSAHDRDLGLDDHRTSNDRSLETLRFGNRQQLERQRQGNREGMVDYRNENPPPAGPRAARETIVSVATPQEAMKLPKGTKFRTPDGKVKIRP